MKNLNLCYSHRPSPSLHCWLAGLHAAHLTLPYMLPTAVPATEDRSGSQHPEVTSRTGVHTEHGGSTGCAPCLVREMGQHLKVEQLRVTQAKREAQDGLGRGDSGSRT